MLCNDIQLYADQYRIFRNRFPEWFDIASKSVDQKSATSIGYDSDNQEDQEYVPVCPELSNAYQQLQLIEEFRVSGSQAVLEELIQQWYNRSQVKQ